MKGILEHSNLSFNEVKKNEYLVNDLVNLLLSERLTAEKIVL